MKKIDFQGLPSTNTPLSPKILNQMQDNIEEGIEEKNTYSTEEQVIGTWTNGKPLYRKIVQLSAPTTSANGTYAEGYVTVADNIKLPFIEFAYLRLDDGTTYSIPYINNEGYNTRIVITSKKQLRILNGITTFNGKSMEVGILYTKTTD